MLPTILLVLQLLVTIALVTVILLQRSEGGALGIGGSSSGLMSARGAADLLTRTTTILATLFILLCIAQAVAANVKRAEKSDVQKLLEEAPAPAAATKADGEDGEVPTADLTGGDNATKAGGAAMNLSNPFLKMKQENEKTDENQKKNNSTIPDAR